MKREGSRLFATGIWHIDLCVLVSTSWRASSYLSGIPAPVIIFYPWRTRAVPNPDLALVSRFNRINARLFYPVTLHNGRQRLQERRLGPPEISGEYELSRWSCWREHIMNAHRLITCVQISHALTPVLDDGVFHATAPRKTHSIARRMSAALRVKIKHIPIFMARQPFLNQPDRAALVPALQSVHHY